MRRAPVGHVVWVKRPPTCHDGTKEAAISGTRWPSPVWVLSLVELGALIVPEVASIVLGVMSLVQLRRSDAARPRGHGLAYAGISLSVISLIIATYLYLSRPHG